MSPGQLRLFEHDPIDEAATRNARLLSGKATQADFNAFMETNWACGISKRMTLFWYWGWHERELSGVDATPGVYAIYDASERLLYIGSSSNLKVRLDNHPVLKKRPQFFLKVRYCHPKMYEWLAIEARLIHRLKPPLNRQYRHIRTWGVA